MRRVEVLIVGGGPAGAACAGCLVQAGADCLVLDKATFPRPVCCAGWVTPRLWQALGMRAQDYPHGLTSFTSFQVHLNKLCFSLPTRQYAVRRVEFDAWMLQRSGAPVQQHTVKEIQTSAGGYLVDGEFWGRYLIGAGGTHCPVRAQLFSAHPRPGGALVTAMEEEFQHPGADARVRLWFFQNGLNGYAWYFPKAGGWLNVGLGGLVQPARRGGASLRQHWRMLEERLEREGLVRGHTFRPVGRAYYLRGKGTALRMGNALLVGDSAGLATLDMGEGIAPAVSSALQAAEAVLGGGEYRLEGIPTRSLWSLLFGGMLPGA